jgi:hypothetical protein
LDEAIHGKPPDGFMPTYSTNHSKAVPGSHFGLGYRGVLHHPAGALLRSARTGIPILNDVPGLPVPEMGSTPLYETKLLATLVAMEAVKLVLPDIAVLTPDELMEFRAENARWLRAFRISLLRYADTLNNELKGRPVDEVAKVTQHLVKTQIAPPLLDLADAMHRPAKSWLERGAEVVKVAPEIVPAVLTMDPHSLLAQALSAGAPILLADVVAKAKQQAELKRSGLYYLLRVKQRMSR